MDENSDYHILWFDSSAAVQQTKPHKQNVEKNISATSWTHP